MNKNSYKQNYLKQCKLNNEKPDLIFACWMDEIEKIVYLQIKIRLLDLPDENYWTLFDAKTPAKDVAQLIIDDINEMENDLMH